MKPNSSISLSPSLPQLSVACLALLWSSSWACSSPQSGAATPQEGGGGQKSFEAIGQDEEQPAENLGGAAAAQHPLFGEGSYTGIDESDPCNTAPIWKEETAIELETGSVVLFEGVLWKLTGTISENWALPACTPPGIDWCATQYAWQQVGTCPQ